MENLEARPYPVQMEQGARPELSCISWSRGGLFALPFRNPSLAFQLDQLLFGRQGFEIPASGSTVVIPSTSAHDGHGNETSLGSSFRALSQPR